jgi:hypothetical protein
MAGTVGVGSGNYQTTIFNWIGNRVTSKKISGEQSIN